MPWRLLASLSVLVSTFLWAFRWFGQPSAPAASSVRPVVDGENAFPEARQLISTADRWCYVTSLAIDERLRCSGVTSRSRNVPAFADELKQRAAALARAGAVPDFKILVWEPSTLASLAVDSDVYAAPRIDVGELSLVRLDWNDIEALDDDGLVRFARDHGSGAPRDLLLRFFHAYQDIQNRVHQQPWGNDLLFPSGIHLVLQGHEINSIGAHHQKYVLTDRGAWVGGLNFLQDWWDRRSHVRPPHAERFTSDDAADDPDPSHPHDDPGPLHDTAVIVQGPVVTQLVAWFKKRWDDAVQKRGDYEHLRDLLSARALSHQHVVANNYVSLVRHLEALNPTVNLSATPIGRAADPRFRADQVEVTVSLPAPKPLKAGWGGERREILTQYQRTIGLLQTRESHLYIENQFFTDHRLAEAIYAQWKLTLHDQPFGVIVIPYKPHFPHRLLQWWKLEDFVEAEMQNVKWLEIKTARDFYVWEDPKSWVPKWEIPNPELRQVYFVDQDVDTHPAKLQTSSEFVLVRPNPWDPQLNGFSPQRSSVDVRLRVDEVMTTACDVTAYTLLARDAPMGPAGAPKRRAGRDVLETYQIYVHSKCSLFLNPPTGPNWATVGSANLNERSLDDHGEQDTELNVWWRHTERVDAYRRDLWSEHLEEQDPAKLRIVDWVVQGWENYKALLESRRPVTGRVVRLDVVDRYEQYK